MLLSLALGLAPTNAQTQNRAGLVIQYGDGSVATTCVRFGEPSITGLDLLMRSGLSIHAEVSGLGAAVCAINGQGCAYPAQPCFCQCQGANCAYWNYLHLIDGAWQYSPVGASGYAVTDGAVDGWAWGDQHTPPPHTIDQMCASFPAAQATAPAAAPATATTEATDMATVTDTLGAAVPTPVASPTQIGPPTEVRAPTAVAAPKPSVAHIPTREDVGSYALFAIMVVALGGWLMVNRLRRR